MALEIKRAPVLRGKAARDFYKAWAQATESKSPDEVREIQRTTEAFLAKQTHLYAFKNGL
jgi:hypothetical protein